MPYPRKTLTQLRDDILAAINGARITDQNGSVLVGLLNKAILRIMAYAQAGVGYEHYGELDWIAKQAVPWTATDEFLEGWAGLKKVTRLAATFSVWSVTWTATGASSVAANFPVTRAGDGAAFVTTASAATTGAGPLVVSIQAVTPGSAGNALPGAQFVFSSQVANVPSASTASAQTTAGVDVELDAALRTRMLAAYAAPPQGGDANDYVEWALSVAGVTRAWVAPLLNGAGTVGVYFMMDIAEAVNGGFPQGTNGVATNETRGVAATGDQLTLANALYPQRPVTALVSVYAPTPEPVNFLIQGLGPTFATWLTQIQAALTDMFVRLGNVGGTINPTNGAPWPGIQEDDWNEAIGAIPGIPDFTVTSPFTEIMPGVGQLFTLGTVGLGA